MVTMYTSQLEKTATARHSNNDDDDDKKNTRATSTACADMIWRYILCLTVFDSPPMYVK